MGWPLIEGLNNSFDYTIQLSIDLIIPEAQYSIPGLFKKLIPRGVALNILFEGMLPSIDLDNELSATTFKIDDVRRKRRLPAEVMTQNA